MSAEILVCALRQPSAKRPGYVSARICRLRVTDVDVVRQRIFVGLPNKANRERWALFSDKTKRYFIEWMTERSPTRGHDYLLHNTLGNPLQISTLTNEFNRTLCKTYEGKTVNETGFDKWSTHRLRHTMASNLVSAGADAATVMAAGGWNSYEAMANYARVDVEVARRGYDEAMRRAKETRHYSPSRKSLTPSELLQRRQVQQVQPQLIKKSERCV
jgi:integrase/recombinase XerC